MSTRSQIVIDVAQSYSEDNKNNGTKRTSFYHHHDGYLNGVGMELIKTLIKLESEEIETIKSLIYFTSFLKRNLNCFYEEEPNYEMHGDIEFLYHIKVTKKGVTLTAYERNYEEKEQDFTKYKNIELLSIRKMDNFDSLQVTKINFKTEI